MPEEFRAAPTPADVAALAAAVERDDQLSDEERQRRDRNIALALNSRRSNPRNTALAWLDGVCAEDADLGLLRERAAAARQAGTALVIALGLAFGMATTLAVFYYDGTGRVNVVAVFGIMVLLPLVLLIPFLLACLPARVTAWIPGAKAASLFLHGLSPGRLAGLAHRWLPAGWRRGWEELAGPMKRHQRLYAGLRKWDLLRLSQLFGLAWQSAAVGMACALVIFTDLAFGWSTTLTSGDADADARQVHRVASTLAQPWQAALPAAVPSLDLVRESRYYRVVTGGVGPDEAARLGGWWPFVVMAMLMYGLLPRLVACAIAHHRLRSQVAAAIEATPGLGAVLRRLHGTRIKTTAAEPDHRHDIADTQADTVPVLEPGNGAYAAVINWSGVPVGDSELAARFGGAKLHAAGGATPVEQDWALAARLTANSGGDGDVAIVVKAWEPPLLEFIDFTSALRQALGPGRAIAVVPVGVDPPSGLAPPTPAQVDIWRRKLSRAGDPWLRIAPVPQRHHA